MTTRERAEAVYRRLVPLDRCVCHEIDFTNWPKDLRAACGFCRQLDVVEQFAQQIRAEAIEEAAQVAEQHANQCCVNDAFAERLHGVVNHAAQSIAQAIRQLRAGEEGR